MKYADPQTIDCPACGDVGRHRVADLLALTARCLACGQSFREIGEEMNGQLRKVDHFAIAMHISFAIADLDPRLVIPEEDLDKIENLQDIVTMMERTLAADRTSSAKDVVYAAVRALFPDIERPPLDIALADLFGARMDELYTRLYRTPHKL